MEERRSGGERRSQFRDAARRLETVEQQNRRLQAFVTAVRASLARTGDWEADDSAWCTAVGEIEVALWDLVEYD